ncbi:hypothetical protein OSTOST_09221 [Ostertagia ostertagi]
MSALTPGCHNLKPGTGWKFVALLLDSGAQHSFIKEDIAHKLGLAFKDPQPVTTKSFGGHTTTETSYTVSLTLRDQADAEMRLILTTRKVITSVRANAHVSRRNIKLLRHSNKSMATGDIEIDVLIGIDHYWKIVDLSKTQRLSSGLTLVHTRFGPVTYGLKEPRDKRTYSKSLSVCGLESRSEQDGPDPDVRQLWELEFIGITDSTTPRQDEEINAEVVKRYYDTVQIAQSIQLIPLELHACSFGGVEEEAQWRKSQRLATSSTPPPRIQPPRAVKRALSR